MIRSWVSRFLGIVLLLMISLSAAAQCAMCNQTATTATQANTENAEALNNGILYLMIIPYILLMTIGLLWWKLRNDAKKKAQN